MKQFATYQSNTNSSVDLVSLSLDTRECPEVYKLVNKLSLCPSVSINFIIPQRPEELELISL